MTTKTGVLRRLRGRRDDNPIEGRPVEVTWADSPEVDKNFLCFGSDGQPLLTSKVQEISPDGATFSTRNSHYRLEED